MMELFMPDLMKSGGSFIDYHGNVEINDPKIIKHQKKPPLIEIDMQAAYKQKRVHITGSWQIELIGECSRCLKETGYSLKETFYEEFIHLQPGETEVTDLWEEQSSFRGDWLRLDDYFINAFYISHPLKILCSEECKGLCPICGQDRNKSLCNCAEEKTDERWSSLRNLDLKASKSDETGGVRIGGTKEENIQNEKR